MSRLCPVQHISTIAAVNAVNGDETVALAKIKAKQRKDNEEAESTMNANKYKEIVCDMCFVCLCIDWPMANGGAQT